MCALAFRVFVCVLQQQTSSGVMGLSPRPSSVWSVSLSVRRSVLVHTRMSGLFGAALRTSVTHLAETFVYDVFESAEKQICCCAEVLSV